MLHHTPVFLEYILENILQKEHTVVIDATLGEGGHSQAFLERGKTVFAFERDGLLFQKTKARLHSYTEKAKFFPVNANFAEFASYKSYFSEKSKQENFNFILFDLGISKYHYFESGRGFSFQKDEELLMNLDIENAGPSAADIVNTFPKDELEKLFKQLGEEPHAKRYAQALCERRLLQRFTKANELSQCIWDAAPRFEKRKRIHPATRVFQALRISVNRELEPIEAGLLAASNSLAAAGCLSVISYHSLEDRIVKKTFKEMVGKSENYNKYKMPVKAMLEKKKPSYKLLHKKAIQASAEECRKNKAARSAKLRTIERL